MVDAKIHHNVEPPGASPRMSHSKCFDCDCKPIAKDAITDTQLPAPDTTRMSVALLKGDPIEDYWRRDDQYYPGTVFDISTAGRQVINYDNGDIETLNLTNEIWGAGTNLAANSILTRRILSDASKVTKNFYDSISNKPFLWHRAHAFPSYALLSAYESEEAVFKQHVKSTYIADVLQSANVISSHTMYKVMSSNNENL